MGKIHRNTQLGVIREEKEKRDLDSVKLLDRALERGHLLKDQIKKGALTEKDKALLGKIILIDVGFLYFKNKLIHILKIL